MLDNFISPYNATIVERFNQAGMVLVGKTNMDEFAMGSSNENSFYGPVKNPWDLKAVPGGSSGGSCASIAARLVPAATATEPEVLFVNRKPYVVLRELNRRMVAFLVMA